MRPFCAILLLFTAVLLCGCGGNGSVSVHPPAALTITPGTSTLLPRATQTFTASLKGTPVGVAWSVQEGTAGGEITAQGVYTAPYTSGTYHLIATLLTNAAVQTNVPVVVRVGIAGNGRYVLQDLDTRIAGGVQAINNPGQILIEDAVWENGNLTRLAALGPQARGINNKGQIVGADLVPGQFGREKSLAAFWPDKHAAPTYLATFGGENGFAVSINDAGQFVGWASTFTSIDLDFSAAALWQVGGGATQIGGGRATAINNKGEILLGNQLRQSNGTLISLAIVGTALNDLSQVVGYIPDSDGTPHGSLWESGKVTPLGTLGGSASSPRGINATGVIVGTSTLSNGIGHAFVYRSGQMLDLNTLVDSASGWVLQDAVGINSSGQIVGHGSFQGSAHEFLLNPQ